MATKEEFFDFAAEVGFTKHIGSAQATEELAALCHIGPDSYVLDVGCGAGVTPSFLAQTYGCRVAGVDILEAMIQRSRERAAREGVADRVEFRVADAQELPFEDDLFDVVIAESVTSFPADKQKAVDEYARVTKPGGYIGLNESTWLKVPPPPEMIAWVSQDVGATAEPLTEAEWTGLLEGASLDEIVVRIRPVDVQDQAKGMLQRYGCAGMIGIWGKMFRLYLRNPAYRRFLKQVRQTGVVPKQIDEYFGYGLYVGKKPADPSHRFP